MNRHRDHASLRAGTAPVPSRIPPRFTEPRWQGDPRSRPTTDAEAIRSQRRTRSLLRLGGVLFGGLLGWYLVAPVHLLTTLTSLPGPLATQAPTIQAWLVRAYPWVQGAALAGSAWLLILLLIGLHSAIRQATTRRRGQMHTISIDIPRTAAPGIGAGIEFITALAPVLRPHGHERGDEERCVFGLVNHTGDHTVRIVMRIPAPPPTRRGSSDSTLVDAIRSALRGSVPGAMVSDAPDDLRETIAAVTAHQPGAVLATADYVLARHPSYPLRDLGVMVEGDPMGPLVAALQRHPGVWYAGVELITRAIPLKEDWRAPLRERLALITAAANPEDLPAHDALERKIQSPGFDTVIRCMCIAADSATALRQLSTIDTALRGMTRSEGTASQRLWRVGGRRPGRHAGITVIPLTPPTTSTANIPAMGIGTILGSIAGAGAGGLLGGIGLPLLLATLATVIPPLPIHPPLSIPGAWIPLLTGSLGASAGALSVLAASPARRTQRMRQQLARIIARAHRFRWPLPQLMPLPAPGKHRSVLGPYELATLWHPPTPALDSLVAWRGSRYLPPPAAAFLDPAEAADAEHGRPLPPPATPQALGQRRLGIAYALYRDGTRRLIGPTVRDLRQGYDILGSMGSGKSSLIETLVAELVRVGSGCGIIDAKGDLSDRLLRVLPPEVAERVIVVDTTATWIPCINPLDRQIIGTKPRDVITSEIGQIFARIEPEIWAGALGMQEFLFKGMAAILEGEPTPSLVHLERFYQSTRYRRQVLQRVRDQAIHDFWTIQYPAMPEGIKKSMDSLKRRLTGLIGSETGQRLLCQPASTIDLAAAMRERAILIIKFVPEVIGDQNAMFWGAAIFQSLISATFAQQQEPNPDLRWDWPLIVDEVQMFVRAEEAQDAERMWTRTRSMGVGLIGAHQSLHQLGPKLGGIVLSVIGGLCLTSGVRDDTTHDLAQAYASQGVTPDDFTAIKPREELLIRFPLHGRDLGIMSAIPRERPAERPYTGDRRQQPTWEQILANHPDPPADWSAADQDAYRVLVALESYVQQRLQSDSTVLPETIYRVVAHEWITSVQSEYRNDLGLAHPDWTPAELTDQAWAEVQQDIEHLRQIARRRGEHIAQSIAHQESLAPETRMALISYARYGVHPLLNACYVAALQRRYPADDSGGSGSSRGRRNSTGAAGKGSVPAPPTPALVDDGLPPLKVP